MLFRHVSHRYASFKSNHNMIDVRNVSFWQMVYVWVLYAVFERVITSKLTKWHESEYLLNGVMLPEVIELGNRGNKLYCL